MIWPNIVPIRSPLSWACLPTAFSMATGIPFWTLIKEIGHDGSDVIFDYLPDPLNRRGFHPQELIRVMLDHQIAVTELQINPVITTDGKNRYPVVYAGGNFNLFIDRLDGSRAVIAGVTDGGVGHAVAWDGDLYLCFDPATNDPHPLLGVGFNPKFAYLLHRICLTNGP